MAISSAKYLEQLVRRIDKLATTVPLYHRAVRPTRRSLQRWQNTPPEWDTQWWPEVPYEDGVRLGFAEHRLDLPRLIGGTCLAATCVSTDWFVYKGQLWQGLLIADITDRPSQHPVLKMFGKPVEEVTAEDEDPARVWMDRMVKKPLKRFENLAGQALELLTPHQAVVRPRTKHPIHYDSSKSRWLEYLYAQLPSRRQTVSGIDRTDARIEMRVTSIGNVWLASCRVLNQHADELRDTTYRVSPTPDKPQAAAPVEPSPVEPSPVEPSPVEPSPVEPSPVEPSPVEPSPAEPSPAESKPKGKQGRPAFDMDTQKRDEALVTLWQTFKSKRRGRATHSEFLKSLSENQLKHVTPPNAKGFAKLYQRVKARRRRSNLH